MVCLQSMFNVVNRKIIISQLVCSLQALHYDVTHSECPIGSHQRKSKMAFRTSTAFHSHISSLIHT